MATTDINEGLIRAAVESLRPYAKRLLALGVPFGQVEARLRELWVEVAERDHALPGKPQTDSRIALITGINRKEVRRIRSSEREPAPRIFAMNHATSLVSRWLNDPDATDRSGRPRKIPYQAPDGPSFMRLARRVTADLAPRVLLDELVRTGAVEVDDENFVTLTGGAFVPKVGSAETLQILAEDPPELVETMLRNVLADEQEPLLQRKIYYDNLGAESSLKVRQWIRAEGEKFLRRVDRWLSRFDRDRNPKAPGGDRRYAAVGVYFFERGEGGPARGENETKAPKEPSR